MRELAKILLFSAAILLLGCALAPPLYWLGHTDFAASIYPDIAKFTFPRYFNRAVLVAAAILVWPLLRTLGIRRWSDLQLVANPKRWRHLALGFGVASVGLWSTALGIVAVGRAGWRAHIPFDALPGALLSAVAVALIEESLFRGALLGALRRKLPWRRALVTLSVVFAALHFFKPPPGVRFDDVSWTTGFVLVPQLFWQYADPRLLVGSFLTLFMVGMVLGYSVVRSRSLYAALGLHAGWVFALKGFGIFARMQGPVDVWLGRDLLTGVVPVLLVTCCGVLLAVLWRNRKNAALVA